MLHQRVVATGSWIGRTLAEDARLRQSLNDHLESAARSAAPEFAAVPDPAHLRHRASNWDSKEMSEQIELNIGKDLQFIRINGTIVGGHDRRGAVPGVAIAGLDRHGGTCRLGQAHFGAMASRTRPAATTSDAEMRRAPKPSRRKIEPMQAANTTLVSRSATTCAIGAIDMATSAIA